MVGIVFSHRFRRMPQNTLNFFQRNHICRSRREKVPLRMKHDITAFTINPDGRAFAN
jgi:hypothetical protein